VPPPDQRTFPVDVLQSRTTPELVLPATRFPCGENATAVKACPEFVTGPPHAWPVMTVGRPGTWESR
jgi:hypothetical protein